MFIQTCGRSLSIFSQLVKLFRAHQNMLCWEQNLIWAVTWSKQNLVLDVIVSRDVSLLYEDSEGFDFVWLNVLVRTVWATSRMFKRCVRILNPSMVFLEHFSEDSWHGSCSEAVVWVQVMVMCSICQLSVVWEQPNLPQISQTPRAAASFPNPLLWGIYLHRTPANIKCICCPLAAFFSHSHSHTHLNTWVCVMLTASRSAEASCFIYDSSNTFF